MVLFTLVMCGVVGRDELNREGLLKFGLFFLFSYYFFFPYWICFVFVFVFVLFCLFVCLAQGALARSLAGGGRTNMDFSGLVSFRFKEPWN